MRMSETSWAWNAEISFAFKSCLLKYGDTWLFWQCVLKQHLGKQETVDREESNSFIFWSQRMFTLDLYDLINKETEDLKVMWLPWGQHTNRTPNSWAAASATRATPVLSFPPHVGTNYGRAVLNILHAPHFARCAWNICWAQVQPSTWRMEGPGKHCPVLKRLTVSPCR